MNNIYREWLLGLLITYGDKLIDMRRPPAYRDGWQFWDKAFEMNHLAYIDDDDFVTRGFVITPKAAKYLERYDGTRTNENPR